MKNRRIILNYLFSLHSQLGGSLCRENKHNGAQRCKRSLFLESTDADPLKDKKSYGVVGHLVLTSSSENQMEVKRHDKHTQTSKETDDLTLQDIIRMIRDRLTRHDIPCTSAASNSSTILQLDLLKCRCLELIDRMIAIEQQNSLTQKESDSLSFVSFNDDFWLTSEGENSINSLKQTEIIAAQNLTRDKKKVVAGKMAELTSMLVSDEEESNIDTASISSEAEELSQDYENEVPTETKYADQEIYKKIEHISQACTSYFRLHTITECLAAEDEDFSDCSEFDEVISCLDASDYNGLRLSDELSESNCMIRDDDDIELDGSNILTSDSDANDIKKTDSFSSGVDEFHTKSSMTGLTLSSLNTIEEEDEQDKYFYFTTLDKKEQQTNLGAKYQETYSVSDILVSCVQSDVENIENGQTMSLEDSTKKHYNVIVDNRPLTENSAKNLEQEYLEVIVRILTEHCANQDAMNRRMTEILKKMNADINEIDEIKEEMDMESKSFNAAMSTIFSE